jgi:hypothetical protein
VTTEWWIEDDWMAHRYDTPAELLLRGQQIAEQVRARAAEALAQAAAPRSHHS